MSLWSFFFGNGNHESSETNDLDDEVEVSVGGFPDGCGPTCSAVDEDLGDERFVEEFRAEAPMKIGSPEQKRSSEDRRRRVTELQRRLLRASEELDDTLANFNTSPEAP